MASHQLLFGHLTERITDNRSWIGGMMDQNGPRVFAYVDETGDRGARATASPIFGMAAIILSEAGAVRTRAAVQQLRSEFKVPVGTTMSWKDHVKNHDRRRRAAEVLAGVEELKVCYVYAQKSRLRQDSYLTDPQRFYNYVALKMYKNILWTGRNWKGDNARVWTRFGHVRHHDHTTTQEYLRRESRRDSKVPSHLEQGLRWVSADAYLESQAADLFGGFLRAALWPSGDFGYVEPSYLLTVWPKIRNSDSCVIPLGLMSMPRNDVVTDCDWFPCRQCPGKTDGSSRASRGRSTQGGR